jgi:cephalosporin-C deacetylase-like acetyl esterase
MRTLGVLLLFTTVCAAQVTDAQRQLFAYDFKQPLDVKQKQLEQRPWARVFAIDYASPHGGRVTGFLVEPTATGKHPAIVFGHWGPGNATEFVPEAIMYARAGVAAASQPKERRQYSSGHDLNGVAVVSDRAHWLAEKLQTPGIIKAFDDEVRTANP